MKRTDDKSLHYAKEGRRSMGLKITIIKILLLSLLLISGNACASVPEGTDTKPVELWEAMLMAEKNNPALKGSNIEREKSGIDVKIAEGMKLPKIDLWANTTLSEYPSTVVPIREAGVFPPLDTHITRFGIELNIPIYTGGKLEAEKVSAQKTSEAVSEDHKQQRQDLLYSVVSVFSRSLYFRDMKDASEKRIGALEDRERSLTLLLSEGRIPKLDLLRLQTQLSQARHDHIVIEQAEKDALSLLGTLTGNEFPIGSVAAISFDARPDELDKIEKSDVLESSHAVKKSSLLTEAYYARSEAIKGENMPQISFFGRGTGSIGGGSEVYDDWQAGLQVTIKMWDGYVSKNRLKKSLLDIEKARFDLEQTRNQTLNDAREASGSLKGAISKIETASIQLKEAREAFRIEQLRYETGESTITDLLSAESGLWSADASLSKAYYEKIASEANVLRLLGRLSPEMMRFSPDKTNNEKKSEKDEVVR